MSWYDVSSLAYPTQLTWQDAMVLLYYYEQGRKSRTRMVPYREMVGNIHARYGFQAFHSADKLASAVSPILLRSDPEKPGSDQYRLPEICFRDPGPLFDCINAAERRHNEAVENEQKAIAEARANPKTKAMPEAILSPVPITPKPGIGESIGVPLAGETAPSFGGQIAIGSIVQTERGPATVVVGPDGAPALRPLGFMADRDSEPAARNIDDAGDAKKPIKAVKAAAPDAKKSKRRKGHRVTG